MTDQDIAQLAQDLNPDQKATLIRILCGPEETWDETDGEFVMKLHAVDPEDSAISAATLAENAIHKFRDRGEEVPRSLVNVLEKLQKKAKNRR